jgi:hypothetical protein
VLHEVSVSYCSINLECLVDIPDPSDDFISSNSSLHLSVLTETESSDSGKEDDNIFDDQNSGPLME